MQAAQLRLFIIIDIDEESTSKYVDQQLSGIKEKHIVNSDIEREREKKY
jgi:hypothetical protein